VKTTTLSEPIVADAAADMHIRESVLGRKSMGRMLGYAHGGAAGGDWWRALCSVNDGLARDFYLATCTPLRWSTHFPVCTSLDSLLSNPIRMSQVLLG